MWCVNTHTCEHSHTHTHTIDAMTHPQHQHLCTHHAHHTDQSANDHTHQASHRQHMQTTTKKCGCALCVVTNTQKTTLACDQMVVHKHTQHEITIGRKCSNFHCRWENLKTKSSTNVDTKQDQANETDVHNFMKHMQMTQNMDKHALEHGWSRELSIFQNETHADVNKASK